MDGNVFYVKIKDGVGLRFYSKIMPLSQGTAVTVAKITGFYPR